MPQRGLSAHTLKIIAIIAMTIDHIAWAFVDACSAAGILMHLLLVDIEVWLVRMG